MEGFLKVTVIIPFHRNLGHLARSLPAARQSMPDAEIFVVADGAIDDCGPLVAASGARVVQIPGPSGPAVARNAAAAMATGDVLAFVDADVVPAPDALPGMWRLLEADSGLAGVFGAYDLFPLEQNFMSQYRNLSHAYVHEQGSPTASTFWAGLGMIRTAAFRSLGGFDERFRRPSIEDIELGYRLAAAGHSVRLDVRFRGQHLKHWTLGSSVTTDILARGIPWTQLIYRAGSLSNDLNTSIALRVSIVLTLVLAASLALFTPWAAVVAAACAAALIGLNLPYYRWFARRRGMVFAVRVVPVHLVHHLCNGISFVAGTVLHVFRRIGLQLPGMLPPTAWAPRRIPASAPPRTRSCP